MLTVMGFVEGDGSRFTEAWLQANSSEPVLFTGTVSQALDFLRHVGMTFVRSQCGEGDIQTALYIEAYPGEKGEHEVNCCFSAAFVTNFYFDSGVTVRSFDL